jgi:membrane protease YdiL (CAAX protease family)
MGYWTLLVLYNSTGRLRIGWRLLIYYLLVLVSFAVLVVIIARSLPREYALPVGTVLVAVANVFATWFCLRRFEHQPLAAGGIGLDRPWLRHLVIGILAGGSAITVCWFVYRLAGWAEVTRPQYDLVFAGELCALTVVMVGVATWEELAFRGYSFQIMARWNRPVAVLVVGAMFVSAHQRLPAAAQPISVINLFLAHCVLCLAYLRTRSLWLPVGAHLGWNVVQGCVFGMRVSGGQQLASLWETHLQENFWSGGGFGPEGGFVVTLLGVLLLVAMWWWMPQRTPTPDLLSIEQVPSAAVEDAAEGPAE